MSVHDDRRRRMVERDLMGRGITDAHVLAAMGEVPRERFLPAKLAEFAYDDTPLPIEEGQTISQPLIVALMTQALSLEGGERVLEIGTGSGYAAAVLSRIADQVFTVERHGLLADTARDQLAAVEYDNVHVLHADGTEGWPEHAPYDAIIVAAGGPRVPEPLLDQLAPGGRLVIPVGATPREQTLVRVTRDESGELHTEDLGPVRFVPLIGAEGWTEGGFPSPVPETKPKTTSDLVRACAEPFASIDRLESGAFLERVGGARVVLLGESTHGTSEFYATRAALTRALIERRGFNVVAIEGDWPDAQRVDAFCRNHPGPPPPWTAFDRFPTWMWRNTDVREFVSWLRAHNEGLPPAERAAFHGLDLYSLYRSADAVIRYLESVDPAAAQVARVRYGCLTPWEHDPAAYGRAVVTGRFEGCEAEAVQMLTELLQQQLAYEEADGFRFFDAQRNADVVRNAEQYYRIMYRGGRASWNLRDAHMFETLQAVLGHYGEDCRVAVWEHNSHVGDARATEMGTRGEHNLGQLSRQAYGRDAYLVGFGTDRGTVAAADDWGGPVRIKSVRPAVASSHERILRDSGVQAFFLPFRHPGHDDLPHEFAHNRLERAIGVIYRPETELQSHYFQASLSNQFDEFIWFDETRAVEPIPVRTGDGVPDTYPFGL